MTTFLATESDQFYVVPPGKTSLTVDLHGASGQNLNAGVGGKGARLQATIAVIPNETLTIKVGKRSNSGNGGWPNGGTSGQTTNGAGGGGGSTSIWRGTTKLLDAAGGGGAGNSPSTGSDGGHAGYPDGEDGWYFGIQSATNTGKKATQSGGGAAGGGSIGSTNPQTAGTLNQGGHGFGTNFQFSGAGGGGGLYGGGGGGEEGGGGGGASGVPDPTASGVTHTSAENVGDGYAVLPTPPETEWWFDRVGF